MIGLDLGFGAFKFYDGTKTVNIVNQVAHKSVGTFVSAVSGEATPKYNRVTFNGLTYYVGHGAHDIGTPLEGFDYQKLAGSVEVQALFYAGMARYEEGLKTSMVVGLPLGTLYASMDGKEAFIAAVKAWLTGTHNFEVDGVKRTCTIQHVTIAAQPAASFINYVYDETGKIKVAKSVYANEVAVVSIGFNTVEMMVLRDRQPVTRLSGNAISGVRRLLELMNRGGSFTYAELDERENKPGKIKPSIVEPWIREIAGKVEQLWGQTATLSNRFSTILITGGGSINHAAEFKKIFPNCVIMDDPVFSCARGLYTLGVMSTR